MVAEFLPYHVFLRYNYEFGRLEILWQGIEIGQGSETRAFPSLAVALEPPMWTPDTRSNRGRNDLRYPSDLTGTANASSRRSTATDGSPGILGQRSLRRPPLRSLRHAANPASSLLPLRLESDAEVRNADTYWESPQILLANKLNVQGH
jgi:hypothetical protein